MDKGANTTQNIVIAVAIFLGIIIVLIIGYSLYTKAKLAEGELANKIALENATAKRTGTPNISLTNEVKNTSGFTYDGLIQKGKDTATSTNNFEIVNETVPVEVPKEEVEIPKEVTEVEEEIIELPKEPVQPKPAPTTFVDNDDRPLTAEEIAAIRRLPIENSPSGNLQTSLEQQSGGEYKARY